MRRALLLGAGLALLSAPTGVGQTPVGPVLTESPAASSAPTQSSEVNVFWLLGQSNAEGAVAGFWLANPFNAGGRYFGLHDQPQLKIWWPGHSAQRPTSVPAWESYRTGSFNPVNNATYHLTEGACGTEASFGGAAIQALGGPVYVFKYTQVAPLRPEERSTFSKRADRETIYDAVFAGWQAAASQLRAQNLVPKVRGVLWVHGEYDMAPEHARNYAQNLTQFIADLRADVLRLAPDNGPVRFVIAEMHDRHVPASRFDVGEVLIRASQVQVVRTVPDTALADVDDLTLDTASPFHIHFDGPGLMELGERMFAVWSDTDRE